MKLTRKIACAIATAVIMVPALSMAVSCSTGQGGRGGGGGGGGGGGPTPKPPTPEVWSAPELTWINKSFTFSTKPGQTKFKFDQCVNITRALYTDEKIKSITLVDFSTAVGAVSATVDSQSITINSKTNNISFEINLDISDAQRFDSNLFSNFKFKFEFEYKDESGESIFDRRDSSITVNYTPYGKNYVTYKGEKTATEIIESSQSGQTSFAYNNNDFRLASSLISELGEKVEVTIDQDPSKRISFSDPEPLTVDGQSIKVCAMNFNPTNPEENETYNFKLIFTISTDEIAEESKSTFNFTYKYYHSYVNQDNVSWTGTDDDAKFITTSNYNVTIGHENDSAKLKLGRPLKDDESFSASLKFTNGNDNNLIIAQTSNYIVGANSYVKIDLSLKKPEFMAEPVSFKILFSFSDKFGKKEEVECSQTFVYQYQEPEPEPPEPETKLEIDNQTLYNGDTLVPISCTLPGDMTGKKVDSYEVTFTPSTVGDRQQEIVFKTFAGVTPQMADNEKTLSFTLMVSPYDFYTDQDFTNCVVKFKIEKDDQSTFEIESNEFNISYHHELGAFCPLKNESKAQDPQEYIKDRSFSILTGLDDSAEGGDPSIRHSGWILSRAPAVKKYGDENFTYYFVTTWRFQGDCEINYSAKPNTSYIAFGDNEHATSLEDVTGFPGATPRWFSTFENYWTMRFSNDVNADFKWVDDIPDIFHLHEEENWYSAVSTGEDENDYFGPGTANIAVARVNFGASVEKMQQEGSPSRALALKNKLRKLNDWTLRDESKGDQTSKGHINNLANEFVDPSDDCHLDDFFYCSGYSANSLYNDDLKKEIMCSTFEDNIDYVKYEGNYVLRGETSYNDYCVVDHGRTGYFWETPEQALIAGIKQKAYFRCPRYNWSNHNFIRRDSYWNEEQLRFKGLPNFGTFGSMLAMPSENNNLQILGLLSMAINPKPIYQDLDVSKYKYWTPVWDAYVDNASAGEHHYDWNILGPYDKPL